MTVKRHEVNGMRVIAVAERPGEVLGGRYSVLLHRKNAPFKGRPFVGASYWDGKSDHWGSGMYDMDLEQAMDWLRHRTSPAAGVVSIP